ncbi:MAG: hypothetical protein FD129_2377 [bacterium]|nr:MAG: hypothetical protein FD129_2377 [bacterium]
MPGAAPTRLRQTSRLPAGGFDSDQSIVTDQSRVSAVSDAGGRGAIGSPYRMASRVSDS